MRRGFVLAKAARATRGVLVRGDQERLHRGTASRRIVCGVVLLGSDEQPASLGEIAATKSELRLRRPYVVWVGTVGRARTCRGWSRRSRSWLRPIETSSSCSSGRKDGGRSSTRSSGRLMRGHVRGSACSASSPTTIAARSLAGAAAFCYPSTKEGFGLPVLEAMIQGTPVVTSAGTSTEEVAAGAHCSSTRRSPGAIADALRERARRREPRGPPVVGRSTPRAAELTWARCAEKTHAVVLGARGGTVAMSDLHVGVNLLWLVPGGVGGSEEYICRLLEGFDEIPQHEIELTLFVNRRFWGAHPALANAHPSRGRRDLGAVALGPCRRRVDLAAHADEHARRRPRASSRWHGAGAHAHTGAPFIARSAVPRPPRVLLEREAALPCAPRCRDRRRRPRTSPLRPSSCAAR